MADGQDTPYVSSAGTHSGVVVFLGDWAYKLKKPVDLGFLDFRSREARLAACHREVELNRRLAPDVYLGVVDVHGPDGNVCEHAVLMRRMPVERSLAALIGADAPVDDTIREIARLIASFHASADRSDEISTQGSRDAVHERWLGHLEDLHPFRGNLLDDGLVGEIEQRARNFLVGRQPLFERRIIEGRILDGHGDLLAGDIFSLEDGPRVLDCLDFDDRLRWLDGLDDVCCLAMDLEYLGRADLADRFLRWYAEFGGDPASASLRHHYVAYRALMRARVDCLRHEQGEEPAASDARRHAELALAHLRAGSVRLVLVGACRARASPRWPAAADYRQDLYNSAHTARTYAALVDRAEDLLSHGESVVLDASWTRAAHREPAVRRAERTSSELVALQCTVPREEAAQRMRDRTGGASDADEDVAAAMAAEVDPWPEAYTLSTAGPSERVVDRALSLVGVGPR